MVVSGTLDCQFVLVVKEAAVPKARPGSTFGSFCGLKGIHACIRSIKYSSVIDTPLNRSMAIVYSDQRISWRSSMPVKQYTSFSKGRSSGSRKVFWRLNTRVMKIPMGFVMRKITSRKKRIWDQPFAVIAKTAPLSTARKIGTREQGHR